MMSTAQRNKNKSVDAFAKQAQDPKAMVVVGEFYYTRIGTPITQLMTKADGLIDVDPYFSANVALSDDDAKFMEEEGFIVREPTKDIPKPHVVFRRNVKTPETKVDFFDKQGQKMDYETLIGNGTTGQVLVWVYDREDGKKAGALLGVQVDELVEYVAEKPKKSFTKKATTPASGTSRKPVSFTKKPEPTLEDELSDEIPF